MTASKTKRLLYFMSELEKGNDISKTDYLARFGISERTLKEDVSELKENLTELRPNMKWLSILENTWFLSCPV